jgi:hypothetical protein
VLRRCLFREESRVHVFDVCVSVEEEDGPPEAFAVSDDGDGAWAC